MIYRFVADLCEELDIPVPQISYDTSYFSSATMMAMCDGNTIYVKKSEKPDPDQLFSIAHELRHIWQLKSNEAYFFSDYKTREELDMESYNLQIAEIDANAFATVIMIDWFGLKPLYNGLSEKVKTDIEDYIRDIFEDE